MPDQIATVAGAGAPGTFQGFDFSPITARGWGRITQWVRSVLLQPAIDQMQGIRDPAIRQLVFDRAMSFCSRVSPFVGEHEDSEAREAFAVTLGSPDGLMKILMESALAAQRHGGAYHREVIDEAWAEDLMDNRLGNPKGAVEYIMQISGQRMERWRGNAAPAPNGDAAAAVTKNG